MVGSIYKQLKEEVWCPTMVRRFKNLRSLLWLHLSYIPGTKTACEWINRVICHLRIAVTSWPQLNQATGSYEWLPIVTGSYGQLRIATRSYRWLQIPVDNYG